ncbi:NAD(P)-binding protein [Auricularia subglabra TFB-10046 SS5]|nr:NAD(P)-binding protein [Auricularia subglabra TFB-10046 SS5]
MPVWFITGTSRGIGLETVRQLSANKANRIIASCRTPASASALQKIAGIDIVPLDINSDESVQAAVVQTRAILGPGGGIDYLVNNAGIAAMDEIDSTTPEALRAAFETNVVGTLRVFRAFRPLVEKSARRVVVNVSTSLASIGLDLGTKTASYCIAKTAQNMLTYKLVKQYPELTIFAFNPGWIKTDLGGEWAPLELEPTVKQHIAVYESATLKTHAGKFISYEGDELPW